MERAEGPSDSVKSMGSSSSDWVCRFDVDVNDPGVFVLLRRGRLGARKSESEGDSDGLACEW